MQTQEIKVLQTRIPAHLYNEVEPIFDDMGMSVNDGIRMFITQVRNTRKMPFTSVSRPEIPNEETMVAIHNVENRSGLREVSWDELNSMIMGE
jgi:addiction module RelB/DinJ family antitoxin